MCQFRYFGIRPLRVDADFKIERVVRDEETEE